MSEFLQKSGYFNTVDFFNFSRLKECVVRDHNCNYKFICLGGCPSSALAQNSDHVCGAFENKEIVDKLSFTIYKEIYEKAFLNTKAKTGGVTSE